MCAHVCHICLYMYVFICVAHMCACACMWVGNVYLFSPSRPIATGSLEISVYDILHGFRGRCHVFRQISLPLCCCTQKGYLYPWRQGRKHRAANSQSHKVLEAAVWKEEGWLTDRRSSWQSLDETRNAILDEASEPLRVISSPTKWLRLENDLTFGTVLLNTLFNTVSQACWITTHLTRSSLPKADSWALGLYARDYFKQQNHQAKTKKCTKSGPRWVSERYFVSSRRSERRQGFNLVWCWLEMFARVT